MVAQSTKIAQSGHTDGKVVIRSLKIWHFFLNFCMNKISFENSFAMDFVKELSL